MTIIKTFEDLLPIIPANVEAAALAKMADRKQIVGALVDGLLALDNAITFESKLDSLALGVVMAA